MIFPNGPINTEIAKQLLEDACNPRLLPLMMWDTKDGRHIALKDENRTGSIEHNEAVYYCVEDPSITFRGRYTVERFTQYTLYPKRRVLPWVMVAVMAMIAAWMVLK